jgi:hypothetical protein
VTAAFKYFVPGTQHLLKMMRMSWIDEIVNGSSDDHGRHFAFLDFLQALVGNVVTETRSRLSNIASNWL